jgi:hypothetical protein
MRHFVWTTAIAISLVSACGKSSGTVCAPGVSQGCVCTDGSQGAQSCRGDGTGFAPCLCSGGKPAAAEPEAAPAAVPVQPPTPRVTYVAVLSPLDHYSGRGVELMAAGAILRHDRFRAHTERVDAGEQLDPVFSDSKERENLEKLVAASAISEETARVILDRNPTVRVEVFTDRVALTILDPGNEDVACVIGDGKVGGVPYNATPSTMPQLPSRMRKRGWRIEPQAGELSLQMPNGTEVARFDGSGAAVRGGTCLTTHGVRIGSTLAEVRKDTDFGANSCICVGDQPTVISKELSGAAIHIGAHCSRAMDCEGELPPCPGEWGRHDCTVQTISVQPKPDF